MNDLRSSSLKPILFVLLFAVAGSVLIYLVNRGLFPQGQSVVVYTALDREFSEPIFEAFTRETGIFVLAKYDTESTKTVGLTQALFAERQRPPVRPVLE